MNLFYKYNFGLIIKNNLDSIKSISGINGIIKIINDYPDVNTDYKKQMLNILKSQKSLSQIKKEMSQLITTKNINIKNNMNKKNIAEPKTINVASLLPPSQSPDQIQNPNPKVITNLIKFDQNFIDQNFGRYVEIKIRNLKSTSAAEINEIVDDIKEYEGATPSYVKKIVDILKSQKSSSAIKSNIYALIDNFENNSTLPSNSTEVKIQNIPKKPKKPSISKRPKQIKLNNLHDFSKNELKRLAFRAGIVRLSSDVYNYLLLLIQSYIQTITENLGKLLNYYHKITVSSSLVNQAINFNYGKTIYKV